MCTQTFPVDATSTVYAHNCMYKRVRRNEHAKLARVVMQSTLYCVRILYFSQSYADSGTSLPRLRVRGSNAVERFIVRARPHADGSREIHFHSFEYVFARIG